MDVLVIGAGVCGLTTGICLAEAGLGVTIRAAAPPERTTSVAAGAVWGLVRVGPPDRVLDWGRTGLEVLSKLAAEPGTGVRMASGREVSRTPLEPHYWTELLPGLRMCETSELPDGFSSGWHYTAPVVTMPVYLDYLRARFERAGGRLEIAAVPSLAGLAGVAPVVVNCSGVHARDLVPDHAVLPVRGQVVIAANPGLEEFCINRDEEPPWITYMFPHGDTVLLGGTNEEGNWDAEPSPFIAERIVAHCAAIDPRLREVRILGHRVGLRPYRPEVRLESEPLGGGVLWHNYGHGGAGISLAWGCAAAVTTGILGTPESGPGPRLAWPPTRFRPVVPIAWPDDPGQFREGPLGQQELFTLAVAIAGVMIVGRAVARRLEVPDAIVLVVLGVLVGLIPHVPQAARCSGGC